MISCAFADHLVSKDIAMDSRGIIIQARLGASRFPGKIAAKITADQNLLEFMTAPLAVVGLPVVIAFPDTLEHHAFSKTLKLPGVHFSFADENDVLQRFITTADLFGFSDVVRVCADNPCLNIGFLKALIAEWKPGMDHLTYYTRSGTPAPKTHYGLFAEMVSLEAMKKVSQLTSLSYFHEHVTPYFYEHQDVFNIGKIDMPEPFWSGVPIRLTVDMPEDLDAIQELMKLTEISDIRRLVACCAREEIRAGMENRIKMNTK